MHKLGLTKRRLALGTAMLGVLAALAGCSATGGGQLPGQNAPTATFGFAMVHNSNNSNGSGSGGNSTLAGTYQDGSVKLRFSSGAFTFFPSACAPIAGSYTSTNPSMPGGGTAHLYVCDNGQGPSGGGDTLQISLQGGPYDGYSNSGSVSHGNISIHNN